MRGEAALMLPSQLVSGMYREEQFKVCKGCMPGI